MIINSLTIEAKAQDEMLSFYTNDIKLIMDVDDNLILSKIIHNQNFYHELQSFISVNKLLSNIVVNGIIMFV